MSHWTHLIEPSHFVPAPAVKAPPPPINEHWLENPWDLTQRECQVMGAVCEYGSTKKTAEALDLSPKTIECYWANVRKKMGVKHILLASLAWDRFARGAQ